MKWSFRIATVRGIDIRIHLTFPLIIAYAVYQSSVEFAAPWSGALFGLASVSLLFVCVVLHELAHSLQAVALGIQVQNITLLPIGGVSQLTSNPERPSDELRIAIAGPAISLALAGLLYGALLLGFRANWVRDFWHLRYLLAEPGWATLLIYLIFANLLLALFNLVPAFPMDGGRVLRSLLSFWLGPSRAVSIASVIGRILAVLMALVGIITVSFSLLIVALFVYAGASLESHFFRLQQTLERMSAADILVPPGTVLGYDLPLGLASEIADSTRQEDFAVSQGSMWVGMISIEDIARALKKHSPEAALSEFVHRDFPVFAPSANLFAVYRAVQESPARAAAVRVDDRYVGIIGRSELRRALQHASSRRRDGARA